MTTHLIDRTSPMGGPFRGTCRYCGATELPASAATLECPAATEAGLTSDETVVDAIREPDE